MSGDLFARGCFVTGTDTGAGKTFASAVLLHAMRRDGRPAVGMKPVASGCERTNEGWRNEDALALQAASDPRPGYQLVNPYALPEPTAPQIAAAMAGVQVELATLLAAHGVLAGQAGGRVLVEGVGGWLAPLADGLEQADLARALDLPLVLVVGLRLGCLNHARLTARAVEADGCRLAGWIGNQVEAPGPHAAAYLDLLRNALPGPCLGLLPFAPGAAPADLAAKLSLA
ncbi:dethiobiotin synthase [Arenimonas sp.]|uniref:dethiobiotin synthase n=1 Tax=Arenimonas sp. TaxID=1872635 RepID=UPI0035B06FFD